MSSTPRVLGNGYRIGYRLYDSQPNDIIGVDAMKCPNCGLLNPESAQRCDCGFDFPSKQVKESYLPRKRVYGGHFMTEAERRQLIRQWFDLPRPRISALALATGTVAFLAALVSGVGALAGVGLIIFSFVAWRYFNAAAAYRKRPSIDEMLEWLPQDFETVTTKSLSKFGLNSNELVLESRFVVGPVRGGERPVDSRKNAPLLFRRLRFWAAHFTMGMIMIYQCTYEWPRDIQTDERTLGIGYEHIVAVAGGEEHLTLSLSNQGEQKIDLNLASASANAEAVKEYRELFAQAIHGGRRNWAAGVRQHAAVGGTSREATAASAPTLAVPSARPSFCPRCGGALQKTAIYCPGCGAQV